MELDRAFPRPFRVKRSFFARSHRSSVPRSPGLILACAGIGLSAPAEESFLLDVLRHNPSVRAESLSIAGTRATREGQSSLLLPQFTLQGDAEASASPSGSNGTWNTQGTGSASQILPTGGTLQADVFGGRSSRISGDIRDTVGVGISLNQPLLRGFGDGSATFHAIDQSKGAERIQVQASRATVLALLSQARTAWWKQRALESVLAAHIQDTVRTQRLLVDARQNLISGAGSILDTIRARADHLQARSEWLDAWTAARTGAVDLGAFIDSRDSWISPHLPSDSAILPPDTLTQAWPSLDSLVHLAEAGAPVIAQALAQEDQARSEKIFRERETLPSLDAGAFARHALVPGNSVPKTRLGVQATLSWDISAGVNRAAARKAYLDLRKAGVLSAKARSDIRRTLSKLLDQSAQYNESVALQRQLVEAKRMQLVAADQGFRDGSVSWSELATVRRDWLAAVGSAWNSVALAEQTESDIQSLTGTGASRLGWSWGE